MTEPGYQVGFLGGYGPGEVIIPPIVIDPPPPPVDPPPEPEPETGLVEFADRPGRLPPIRLEWQDPAGNVIRLDDLAGVDELGTDGLWMPPWDLIDEAVPDAGGTRLRGVRAKAREVTIPVLAQAADSALLHASLRTLIASMNPLDGDGILRAVLPDGSSRELTCRYTGGLEISLQASSFDIYRGRWQMASLLLRAFDPYWRDSIPVALSFTNGPPMPFFPFLPLVVANSRLSGDAGLTNSGDVETWPVWTVTGPASGFTLTDSTHGVSLVYVGALQAGESVTVDTRPGIKTVTRETGANVYANLTTSSALWPIRRGSTTISIGVPDADADTYVTLTYAPRYLTP